MIQDPNVPTLISELRRELQKQIDDLKKEVEYLKKKLDLPNKTKDYER